MEDVMNFISEDERTPIISVVGVGGGGSNAVRDMYDKGIEDVNYIVCNTDLNALELSPVPLKVLLGERLSDGDGAGNKADNGEFAAIESLDEVMDSIEDNTKMVFITAGMGAGTGTGATPIIAKAIKERDILTIGIVTIPFRFEGPKRIKQAAKGIIKLEQYVDSLIIVDNERIFDLYPDISFSAARSKADEIVANSAKGIVELITLGGYINVDFEDVKTVMSNSGVALMGSAEASGEERALNAIKLALKSPLLENSDIQGAKFILLNIISSSGHDEIRMDEVSEITDYVISQVGIESQVIWGLGYDNNLGDEVSVTIVATDFKAKAIEEILELEDFDLGVIREEIVKESKVLPKKEKIKIEEDISIDDELIEEDKELEKIVEVEKEVIEGVNNPETILSNKHVDSVIIDNKEITSKVIEPVEKTEYKTNENIAIKSQIEIKEKKEVNNKSRSDFFRAQIVMHPDMREKDIEKIENTPAYERHKTIIE